MAIKNILVIYAKPYNKEQRLTLLTVKRVLKANKIAAKYCERTALSDKNFIKKDMCIVVGGDGTFLRACQFIEDTPVAGVNSDIKTKEGYYMKLNRSNFTSGFKNIIAGKFKTVKLTRLGAKINNKPIYCKALNEYYFGAEKAYMTSRYRIDANNKSELQRSSGVVIATPTGTMAWSKAVGAETLPVNFSGFRFIVREPFEHKIFSGYALNYGTLRKGQVIKLRSQMGNGILVADSVSKEHRIKYGDAVAIGISNQYVNAVDEL